MTIQSWKNEFYPVEAQKVAISDALQHSLVKWKGLTAENLSRHEVKSYLGVLKDEVGDEVLCIDSSSCALCVHYLGDDDPHEHQCTGCPLFEVRGVGCDEKTYGRDAPYQCFSSYSAPMPMIALIEEAIVLWRTRVAEPTKR